MGKIFQMEVEYNNKNFFVEKGFRKGLYVAINAQPFYAFNVLVIFLQGI